MAPSSRSPGDIVPAHLGHYVLDRVVAVGELSSVYRARTVEGDAQVAVKIYDPQLARADAARVGLAAAAQQRVLHPSVARLLDWGELSGGELAVISEWIEGETLAERLRRAPLGWERLVPILEALASGLAAIHAANVLHRDVKPSNIVVPARGPLAAVIIDFGHALAAHTERITEDGIVLGSAAYMAPEQAMGIDLDARADLYALGVTLYEALTGRLPFEDRSAAEVMRRHQTDPVIRPRHRAPERNIPVVADDLCMWLLEKDRARRLPSARVLTATLRALVIPPQSLEIEEQP